MPDPKSYLALIGDLVGSREESPEDRQFQQKVVARLLAEENQRLGPERLAAPIVQTAGDEVQALFRGPDGLVDFARALTDELHGRAERPIALGLGLGAISTPAMPPAPGQAANVALVDGPAFHRARAALERARKRRDWAVFEGFGDPGDLLLDYVFQSMWAIRGRWTVAQMGYAIDMRRLGVQKEVALQNRVSPSVVSESLKAAAFDTVLAGEEAARRALSFFCGLVRQP